MACLLFFNFVLSLIATSLIITGITTPRWLVFTDGTNSNIRSERSIGIINSCQRLYHLADTDQYLTFSNGSSHSIVDDAFVCFNRLLKWNNASSSGPELFEYQKVLIGISFSCGFVSIIALIFTQPLKSSSSFQNLNFCKRVIEFLLVINILAVILGLVTLALFLGFERLQMINTYGYSFWLFVAGTGTLFLNCIVTAVYRIDIEFEFRRYRHESVATLC